MSVDLIVLVENPLELVGWDPDAGILDGDARTFVIFDAPQSDQALIGVLERVAEQILEELIEQRPVRRDDARVPRELRPGAARLRWIS